MLDIVYDQGDAPVIQATFKNAAKVLTDPTAMVVQIIKPDGQQMDAYNYPGPGFTQVSTGVWQFLFPFVLDQSGEWKVKWYGTATLTGAEEIKFLCRETDFTLPA